MFFKEKYKNYVMYGGLNKMDKLKKALPFIIPPLAVLLIMGFAFYRHGLYSDTHRKSLSRYPALYFP